MKQQLHVIDKLHASRLASELLQMHGFEGAKVIPKLEAHEIKELEDMAVNSLLAKDEEWQ